jgi:hypothetical protein
MNLAFEDEAGSDNECKFDHNGILRIGPFSFSSEIGVALKRRLIFLYRPIKSQISALRLGIYCLIGREWTAGPTHP